MIGRLLGHPKVGTTARYAHLMRDAEKAAAARTGDSIRAHIMPPDCGATINLRLRIASFGFAPQRRFRCLISMFPSAWVPSDVPFS